MNTPLETVRRTHEDLLARGRSIIELAEGANRTLSSSETEEVTKIRADVLHAEARIAELERAEDRVDLESSVRQFTGGRGGSRHTVDGDRVAEQFRSMLLDRNPTPIEVRTSNPKSYVQPGVEKRDLLLSAPANFTPVSFYDRIVETMFETSAVLKAGATLVTTTTGEPLRVPRSTAIGTAGIVTEASPIPESDPTLGVVTLGAFKYGLLAQVSTELLQDSGADLEGYLAREIGTAIAIATGNHFINGTGSGQPRGVLADTTAGITGPTGTSTSLGAQGTANQGTDILNQLYGSLAEPYVLQPSVGFLLRSAMLTAVRNLKGTTGDLVGNQYL